VLEHGGRNRARCFFNFNGTAGIWRREAIESAGGWQHDTLTEDLDLSYRAQLRGWRFLYLPQVMAPAELPAAMDALKSQQFRWTKGGAETARKHLSSVLRAALPFTTKVHATFHLLNSSVFVAVLLLAVLSVPLVFVRQHLPELEPVFSLASLFLLTLVPLVFYYYSAWRRDNPAAPWRAFLLKFLLFLAVSMGLALHNSRAVLLGLAGRRSAFIRTPKLGLIRRRGTWQGRRYRTGRFDGLTVLEGLLTLYFLFGIGAGLYLGDYGLLPFHLLLTMGYGLVFYYSVRHSN
jgi:hypothetical protein